MGKKKITPNKLHLSNQQKKEKKFKGKNKYNQILF